MIVRENYLCKIRKFYNSDLIKVITGIRRCGKSIILDTIRDEIARKSDNIIYLNFEKSSDLMKIGTAQGLIDYVAAHRKDGLCYVFLDEVQEIEEWQTAVKDLRLDKCSVFVTGSNSKLLSNEFLNLLSGRFVSFRIRPFVYKEIAEYAKQAGFSANINDYLVWGGFPGRFSYPDSEANKEYLSMLEDTIVVHDLIARYKIKKTMIFRKIANYVTVSNARIFSARSVYRYIKDEYPDVSLPTIVKYLEYLKEAYVIDELPQFSTKTKKVLSFYGKLYNADVCFNSLHASDNRFDYDHNLENVVYNELLYMGYELFVYSANGKEIDFLATKNGKKYYIQVAYSVVDPKAYDREFSAFQSLDNTHQKLLITTDENDYSTSTVRHISLKDFLQMESL